MWICSPTSPHIAHASRDLALLLGLTFRACRASALCAYLPAGWSRKAVHVVSRYRRFSALIVRHVVRHDRSPRMEQTKHRFVDQREEPKSTLQLGVECCCGQTLGRLWALALHSTRWQERSQELAGFIDGNVRSSFIGGTIATAKSKKINPDAEACLPRQVESRYPEEDVSLCLCFVLAVCSLAQQPCLPSAYATRC